MTWLRAVRNSLSPGKLARFRAQTALPPMAQTSERAFAAAMAPNQYGSSTMGVK